MRIFRAFNFRTHPSVRKYFNTENFQITVSRWSFITTIAQYRILVAIPCVNALLENIKIKFTDKAVKIIIAMSIFNPILLSIEDSLPSYDNEQIKILPNCYGKEAEVQYVGITYTLPPLLDGDELLSKWKIFRGALLVEKRYNGPYKCLYLLLCKTFLTKWKHHKRMEEYSLKHGNYSTS